MSLLSQVHDILVEVPIAHALIGAAAMAVHGVSRSTFDLDLLAVDLACLDRALWQPLEAAGVAVEVRRGDADDPLAGVVRFEAARERPVDLIVGAAWCERAWYRWVGAVSHPVAQPIVLTEDDYLRFPDDGRRWEIIHGEAFVTPAPNLAHQRISRNIGFLLHQHVRSRDLGEVFNAPVNVYLSRSDVVQPDLVYIAKDRSGILVERGIEGAPDLVVEILSPATKNHDLGAKAQLYARHGVKHYWVLDPVAETLAERVLAKTGFALVATHDRSAVFCPDFLDGLSIALSEVFAR